MCFVLPICCVSDFRTDIRTGWMTALTLKEFLFKFSRGDNKLESEDGRENLELEIERKNSV